MTEDYVIETAAVEQIGHLGELLVIATQCGRRMQFFVSHQDYEVRTVGAKAMRALLDGCGIMFGIGDTCELVGKTIHPVAWRQVEIYAEGDGKVRLATDARPDDRYVYVIACTDSAEPLTKVGIASSPERRLKQLSTSSPHSLRLEFIRHSPNAREVEQAAHLHFKPKRRNGEWFAVGAEEAIKYLNHAIDGRKAA